MLYTEIKDLLRNRLKEQDTLYENIIYKAIESGGDMSQAFESYAKQLNYYDAKAFYKVLEHLETQTKQVDNQKYTQILEQFSSIPEYANHRNNFQDKVKDILQADGDRASKQAQIDSLDFSRTKAHNRMILLFNNLNKYALENNLNKPYLIMELDKTDANDRELAAVIMQQHEPVMESISRLLMQAVQSPDYRDMETRFDNDQNL